MYGFRSMEQARMGKHALNMNGRGTTSDIDMGSEIGSHAGQDQSCRENRYSQGLASDIQVQGGLLDGQRAAKFRIPALGSIIILEHDARSLIASHPAGSCLPPSRRRRLLNGPAPSAGWETTHSIAWPQGPISGSRVRQIAQFETRRQTSMSLRIREISSFTELNDCNARTSLSRSMASFWS